MIKITYTGKKTKVYDIHVKNNHNFIANGIVVHNCTEVLLPTSNEETAVCNLGSLNLSKYIKDGKLDKQKIKKNVQIAVKFLDKVIDRNFYPIPEAKNSNMLLRPVGLGLMGLQDLLYQLKIPFESQEALDLSAEIMEEVYYWAVKTSLELAKELGPFPEFKNSHTANGLLHYDHYNIEPKNKKRFDDLKEEIKIHGLRNSLLISPAPTSGIASIVGCEDCIEPTKEHIYKKATLSGDFVLVNKWLVSELKHLNLWSRDLANKIISNNGSITGINEIPQEIQHLYKTVWEIKQKSLIDMAIARAPFIDQSQSLNLFVTTPTIEKLSSMYMYAWGNGKGLKTTYYLRSKAATKIEKTISSVINDPKQNLETPDICESCT